MAANGVIGIAVGALVRKQITAVVGVLVWLLAVEQIVITFFGAIGRWAPEVATSALLQLGPAIGMDEKLLPAPAGGLVLAGYTAAAVAFVLLLTTRRDVL